MSTFVEKRRHRRHTSKLNAQAVFNNGVKRLATTIINLSGGGAMLELSDASPLPDSLTLLYGHSIEPCTVVWQHARRAGVRFDSPPLGSAAA